MRRIVVVLAIFGAMALAAPSSYAGMDVDIRIGVPPPPPPPPPPVVAVQEPPEMVFMPDAGVYVAVGTPYDLFFFGGRYYYFTNGLWYVSSYGYGGPWVHVEYRTIPYGLRRYKIERYHEFRERAWRDYRERGPAYRGRHFKADRGEQRGERRGEGRGEKRGHGERDRRDERHDER